MAVNEIIELLDKEENKYGGATGKERELNLSINGEFLGSIESAKLDGWGDGLITDVTLEVKVDSIKYHDEKIRNKAIDEFAETLKEKYEEHNFHLCLRQNDYYSYSNSCMLFENYIDKIAEQLKAGGKNAID